MNKGELIDKISADAGITKVQANAAIDSFTGSVIATRYHSYRLSSIS